MKNIEVTVIGMHCDEKITVEGEHFFFSEGSLIIKNDKNDTIFAAPDCNVRYVKYSDANLSMNILQAPYETKQEGYRI